MVFRSTLWRMIKGIGLGILILAAAPAAWAALSFYEDFPYPEGPLVANSSSVWTMHSGTLNEVQVVSNSLSYPGLAPSQGNKVVISASKSEDVGRNFTAIAGEGKAAYAAFLINMTTPATTNGDYFSHFCQGTSTSIFYARLFTRQSGAGYILGMAYGANQGVVWAATEYALNTTYLVVYKLSMIAGSSNDTVQVWINPANIGTAIEPTANIIVTSTGTDITATTGIGRFALRQTANMGHSQIDEIRVGDSWADVVPGVATKATLTRAYAFDGKIYAEFDNSPGALGAGSFSLTGSQNLGFSAIDGAGPMRILTPNSALVGDTVMDNLAVTAGASVNAGNVNLYVYPPISAIQQNQVTLGAGDIIAIQGVVNGVQSASTEGSGQPYSVASSAGPWNGIFVQDTRKPAIGTGVELAGTISEIYGVTTLTVTNYLDRGPQTPIEATTIPKSDFVYNTLSDNPPNEQYEGVLIRILSLNNATNNNNGETLFPAANNENYPVLADGLFYNARGTGAIVDGRSYDMTGVGYFSFSTYKMLPRNASDVVAIGDITAPGIYLAMSWSANEIAVIFDEVVTATSAQNTANYQLYSENFAPAGNPTSAVLANSGAYAGRMVTLGFASGTVVSQAVYFMRVSGISDPQGNTMAGSVDSNKFYGQVQPISWAGQQVDYLVVRDPRVCVTVAGVVTSNYQFGAGELYLQDISGGIQSRDLANNGTTISLNDEIKTAGFVAQYNGKPQIARHPDVNIGPLTFKLGSQTGSVTPFLITVPEINETNENNFVMLSNVTIDPGTDVNFAGSKTYAISDQSGSGFLRIDGDTNIAGLPIPTGPVNLRGISSQFSVTYVDGYQLLPRFRTDISFSMTPDTGTPTPSATITPGGPTLTSTPSPTQGDTSIVINKYYNSGVSGGASDAVELLVIHPNLNMGGMLIKDYSSSMANDGGGGYIFAATAPLWANVPAGTLVTVRKDNSAADTTVGGGDYTIDVGLLNPSYFINAATGPFDIGSADMVEIKGSGSVFWGNTGHIHALAAGTPGTWYNSAPPPKLNTTSTAGTSKIAYALNATSSLPDYNGTGAAVADATGFPTFGQANNETNQIYIDMLRGGGSTFTPTPTLSGPTYTPTQTATPTFGPNIIYQQNFESGTLGDMSNTTTNNKPWTIGLIGGRKYAYANAYGADLPADNWLITPPLDLDAYTGEKLSFVTAKNYSDSGPHAFQVLVSNNYAGTGDPQDATWIDLSSQATFSTGSWSWVSSGEIDLATITGSNVYIAWRYQTSGTGSGTAEGWEVDDILVTGFPAGGTPTPTDTATDTAMATATNTPVNTSTPVVYPTLSLSIGWNLVSVPRLPEQNNIPALLAGKLLNSWTYVPGSAWQIPAAFAHKQAYWLRLSAAQAITLDGTPAADNLINLVSGWNFVGVAGPIANVTANPAILNMWSYGPLPTAWTNNPNPLVPGLGYWIRCATTTVIGP